MDVNYFCLVFFMTVPSHRAWISNVIWRVWRPKNPQTTQWWVSEEFEDTKESTNRQHNAEYQKSLKIQKNPQTDNTMLSIRRVWRYKRIHKQTTQCWVSEEFEDTKESTNRQHNDEYQKSLKIQKNPQTDNTMLSIRRIWRYKRIHKQTTQCWVSEEFEDTKESTNRQHNAEYQKSLKIPKNPQTDNTMLSIRRVWRYKRIHKQTTHWPKEKGQKNKQRSKNRGWTQMLQNGTKNRGWTQMFQNGTKNRGWTQMLQNDTNNPGVNSDAPEWH